MRCKLFLFVLALLVSAVFFSCRRGASGGHRLLIYTPHGQDLLKDFVARYKQRYPDANVQFLDMGSREILQRVQVERNRPQADLWWGASHTTFQTAADDNLHVVRVPRHESAFAPTGRSLRRSGARYQSIGVQSPPVMSGLDCMMRG